jgi:hypothetical protein
LGIERDGTMVDRPVRMMAGEAQAGHRVQMRPSDSEKCTDASARQDEAILRSGHGLWDGGIQAVGEAAGVKPAFRR